METAPVHNMIHWSSTTEFAPAPRPSEQPLRDFTYFFHIQAMVINIALLFLHRGALPGPQKEQVEACRHYRDESSISALVPLREIIKPA